MHLSDFRKRVLITGVAGFIGSNLLRHLLQYDKYLVTGIDNFDNFYPRRQKMLNINHFLNNENFIFIEGDILDIANLNQIGEIDVIIHLAAKAGVRPSIQNPLLYQEVNVKGTQNLLEFARERGIQQFLFASSSSVYGINQHVPWKEDEKLMPISPYASTKLSGEMLGHVYSHLYGIRFLALRFFTVYGAGQRPDLAIHKFFRSILNDVPIPVYGDGSTSRDYTYIEDIIYGIEEGIHFDRSNFEIINLGNSHVVTLQRLINEIQDICGKKAVIDWQPEQAGDVKRTFADITKAQKLLNYEPETNLTAGLGAFYDWFILNQHKIN